jgi:predicted nucleic acid-binding protein
VTTLLVDTSVIIKWFHAEGESEVVEARALREATRRGDVEARVIDLALYEMGNVLLRSLHWTGSAVGDQLEDLIVICGSPLAMAAAWLRQAALLAAVHGLTFSDAAWAAAAQALGISLVSADTHLLASGLAESPRAAATRLRLPPPRETRPHRRGARRRWSPRWLLVVATAVAIGVD